MPQTIEVAVLQSVALERQGRAQEALTALDEVVAPGSSLGWIRPFVEAGQPVADLQKQLRKQNVAVDYVDKLLAAFGDNGTGSPSPPLTPSPLLL